MNIEPKPSVATSARTRRTALSVAIAVIATIPIATGASGASDKPTAADPTESTVPTTGLPDETGDSLEPTIGTSIVGDVRLTFTVPDGWENNGWFVAKANSDPIFGAIFFPVANIFSDPCQWVEVDPPPGPTVDDLAAAYADVPVLNPTAATDVTVDGFHGKQIEFTVPDFNEDECRDGRYGIFQEPGWAGRGPNYWAQAPQQYLRLWILDINGTRLVIAATSYPDTSQQDRDDLDTLLNSIQIDALVEAEQSGDDDPFDTSAASSTSSA
jgi:hypothetical protein